MSIETRSADGRYFVRFRRDRGAARFLFDGVTLLAGLALVGATVASTVSLHGTAPVPIAILAVLVAAALVLAVESIRREKTETVLDIASGELEVRGRAYGAVEVDRVVLARRLDEEKHLFSVLLVPRRGPPVALVRDEPSEAEVLDVAMVASRGVGVELDDRRYPGTPVPGGAVPPDLACVGEERREVLTWNCDRRFRPRAALSLLGAVSVLAFLLVETPGMDITGIVVATLLVIAFTIVLGGHLTGSLAVRRITLRPDGVRVERRMAFLTLTRRLIPYDRLKAVLFLRRGPVGILRFRVSGPNPGAFLPLEDPAIAECVKRKVERAAHAAGQSRWEATLR